MTRLRLLAWYLYNLTNHLPQLDPNRYHTLLDEFASYGKREMIDLVNDLRQNYSEFNKELDSRTTESIVSQIV